MVVSDAICASDMCNQQYGTDMPTIYPTRFERKALLVARGVTMAEVAIELDLDPSFVSRVIAGKRGVARSDAAMRVMEYVANRVGATVAELWPSVA